MLLLVNGIWGPKVSAIPTSETALLRGYEKHDLSAANKSAGSLSATGMKTLFGARARLLLCRVT